MGTSTSGRPVRWGSSTLLLVALTQTSSCSPARPPPRTPRCEVWSSGNPDDGSVIDLNETFASGTTAYTADVAGDVDRITIVPSLTSAAAGFIWLDADDMTLADADDTTDDFDLDLDKGENTVKVKVTSEDTLETRTYTVVVTREDALWTATLTVGESSGGHGYCQGAGSQRCGYGTLSDDGFTLDATDYTVESVRWGEGGLLSSRAKLHLTLDGDLPDAELHTLTLEVGGERFALSDASRGNTDNDVDNNYRWPRITQAIHDLERGDTVTVRLIHDAGALSPDATLSALALADEDGDTIALAPAFDPDNTAYSAAVAGGVDRVTLTATKNHPDATVAIAGDDDTSTPGEADLGLVEGVNALTVTVTAEDGATATYTLTVTRAAAAPATRSGAPP